MITIGIDPHKSSLTAAGLSPDGTILATARVTVNTTVLDELLAFADSWPQQQWAVEGASGLGLGIAQRLVAHGQDVIDVPAILAARTRLLSPGHGRKTDAKDAATVALVAQHHRRLRRVQAEDLASVIRLVSDHRDDLVAEHTSAMNRLHRLLRDLIPGGAKTQLSTRQAADLLRRVRPVTATETARKQLARDLIVGLRALEVRTKTLTDQLGALVAQSGTTLTEIPGVASIVAAKVIGHTGNIARFPDQHHFASFNGTAPIDASSGDQTRHRLSRRGDRQLNAAIHVIAIYQISHPGPGQDYYRKKLAQSKTPKEARRALKRRLSRRRLSPSRQRPRHLTPGRCLTQRRYEVTPPGRSHAEMLPAGSTDRSKDSNYRVSRAVSQTKRVTPQSSSLSCGTHAGSRFTCGGR